MVPELSGFPSWLLKEGNFLIRGLLDVWYWDDDLVDEEMLLTFWEFAVFNPLRVNADRLVRFILKMHFYHVSSLSKQSGPQKTYKEDGRDIIF